MIVWLVGMPGSGKSTVGRRVARRLGARFVDADREIERRAGMEVEAIFASGGEREFRRLEAEVVADLARRDGLVVACGGGAVLAEANREAMRRSGAVVLLEAPLEVLAERIGRSGGRPLLARGGDLAAMAEARAEAYRAAADHTVDATGPPAETARRVVEAVS